MDPPTAMDLFPAGGFVRLRSSSYRMYAYADVDAVGAGLFLVSTLGDPPGINAVWIVEHCYIEDDAAPYIMLQSAAYGRYLAVTNRRVRYHRGFRVVQRDDDSPNLDPRFVWRPYRVQGDDVVLTNPWGLNLRANEAKQLFDWIVTAYGPMDDNAHWQVEAIPPSPEPLPLPLPPPPPQSLDVIAGLPDAEFDPLGTGSGAGSVASDEGDVDQEFPDRPNFFFEGRSVFKLRTRVEQDCNIVGITLCVQAGKNANPVPLVTDLPMNQDPMGFVVYTNGSQAAENLRYPQDDQP